VYVCGAHMGTYVNAYKCALVCRCVHWRGGGRSGEARSEANVLYLFGVDILLL